MEAAIFVADDATIPEPGASAHLQPQLQDETEPWGEEVEEVKEQEEKQTDELSPGKFRDSKDTCELYWSDEEVPEQVIAIVQEQEERQTEELPPGKSLGFEPESTRYNFDEDEDLQEILEEISQTYS